MTTTQDDVEDIASDLVCQICEQLGSPTSLIALPFFTARPFPSGPAAGKSEVRFVVAYTKAQPGAGDDPNLPELLRTGLIEYLALTIEKLKTETWGPALPDQGVIFSHAERDAWDREPASREDVERERRSALAKDDE